MYSCHLTIFWTIIISWCCQGQIIPCRHNDDDCILRSARAAYPVILSGDPSIGVPSSDPIYIKEVDGTLSILNFIFSDCTYTGNKHCNVQSVKLNLEEMNLRVNLSCPAPTIMGDYVVNGRVIVLPVKGKGKFVILTNTYEIDVDATLKTIKNENGTEYFNIKNFKFSHLEAIGGVTFNFTNLFNGQKDLADAVLKFANENWKEVSLDFQLPLFTALFRKIIINVNKYLKSVPIDKMFIN